MIWCAKSKKQQKQNKTYAKSGQRPAKSSMFIQKVAEQYLKMSKG